ncbi:MAG: formate dehydrogenase, partial [Chloroflexi bacterium]|nr:formate dehydrogenase [Chloroflexota bacterium]
FAALKAGGTTSCGNWIYSVFYPADNSNKAAGRDNKDPSGLGFHPGWGWAWPANRRILYNRCSTRPEGSPWNADKKVIWWDANEKKWAGNDVPDFAPTKAPDARREPNAVGLGALGGTDAFIMKTDGKGWTFTPSGMTDGPLPEHYEPLESPIGNPLSRISFNPASRIWRPDEQGKSDKFPIVGTTYRLSEHMQAGAMSRNLPWLAELMPELFVEMGTDLAKEKGIKSGDPVVIVTARGKVSAVALVTERFRPFSVGGKIVHEIGVPWHFGYAGMITGDSANLLTPHVGDANTMMPEYKAFLCDIQKA